MLALDTRIAPDSCESFTHGLELGIIDDPLDVLVVPLLDLGATHFRHDHIQKRLVGGAVALVDGIAVLDRFYGVHVEVVCEGRVHCFHGVAHRFEDVVDARANIREFF